MESKEYTIALKVNTSEPDKAKLVANEAQGLIDEYGCETFLKAVSFMKSHPDILNMALGMIGIKS